MTDPWSEGQESLSAIPTFSQPRPLDDPIPGSTLESPDPSSPQPEETPPQPVGLLSKLRNLRQGGGGSTTTSASATDRPKASPADIEALAIGVIGLVFLGGAWAYRQRTRRKLRMPTDAESKRIAVPLGRIASRHADLGILGPDLTDVILAGTAFGAYVNKAPLADGPDIDPGSLPQQQLDEGVLYPEPQP